MIVYRSRYVKKHVVGGSGIVDTLKNFLRRAAASSASRAAYTLANKIAKTELRREAIMATNSAGKELASTAISTARGVAIDKGKKTIEKLYAKTGTLKPSEAAKSELSQKSKDIISGIVNRKLASSTPIMDEYSMFGSGLSNKNAIRIQDLVKNSRFLMDSKNLKMGNGLLIA